MAMDFLLHMCETYKIKSWSTSWEYFRQYKQLYASVTGRYMTGTTAEKSSRYVSSRLPCTAVVANGAPKWHDVVLVPRFDLQAPNGGGRTSPTRATCLPSRPSILPTTPASSPGSDIAYNCRGATSPLPTRGRGRPRWCATRRRAARTGVLRRSSVRGSSRHPPATKTQKTSRRKRVPWCLTSSLARDRWPRASKGALLRRHLADGRAPPGNERGCPGNVDQVHTPQGGR